MVVVAVAAALPNPKYSIKRATNDLNIDGEEEEEQKQNNF